LEQGLGGDAAPVQADAAEQFALDDGGLEAQLCGADRGHIAAGARTNDDDVEIHVCLSSRSTPMWGFPQRIKEPTPGCSDRLKHPVWRGSRTESRLLLFLDPLRPASSAGLRSAA